MSRLNVNSVNPHDGVKVSITGSTNGGLVISGSPQHDGHPVLRVEGSISASGELTCSNALFTGDIRVIGESTISASAPGGIFLGDTNTDYVVFGADVSSSIIPDLDDRLDLGTSTQEWKDIYIDGVGYIDAIDQDDVAVTNNLKGDWHWKDDSANVSLFVHSADGNVGVKVADPNQEFEVAGRISASQQLSVGGAGTTDGHITGSGNLVISGTLGGEFLHHITASNISASGNMYATEITTSSDILVKSMLGPSKFELDGAGNLPTIDNDTIVVFQRNLPGNASAAITVLGHAAGESIVKLGDTDDEDIGRIRYQHTDNSMDFFTDNTERLSLSSAGILLTGHVTVSGNISASGIITADVIATDEITDYAGTATIGDDGTTITIQNRQFNSEGHITASGQLLVTGDSGYSKFELDGAGNLISIDNDTIVVFQRNLPGASSAAISVIGHVGGESIIKLGDTDDEDIGRIRYQHTDNSMDFFTDNTQRLSLDSSGFNLTGHVTFSGNISGSATSTLSIGGAATFGTSTVVINGTAGHITSSGNISGSGYGQFENVLVEDQNIRKANGVLDVPGPGFNTTTITASSNISSSGQVIGDSGLFADNQIILSSLGDIQALSIKATQNITASSNISASGTIIANKFEADSLVSRVGDANTGIQMTSDTVDIEANDVIIGKFNTSQIQLNTPVTASGAISASGASTSFINVLSNKRPTETITNSGGSVTNNMTSAVETDPSNKVLIINAGADSNNIAMELPAAEAGLSYTFLSVAAPGASTVTFSAPSAILFGVAICDDGNEDISGTHFQFANSKFLRGTRVECISDGSGWSIQAFCLCDVADVSTT